MDRRRLERLEAKKSALLERVEGVSEEVLARSPGDGEWSVLQILTHLGLVEELAVAHLREQMEQEAPAAGPRTWLRSMALSLAMRSPFRFKAPAPAAALPATGTLDDVRARWDAARSDLSRVLAEVPPEAAARALFRHPRVGRLTLDQATRFLEEHIDHHRAQVERVLAKVG